jgi:cysteine protease ATG4
MEEAEGCHTRRVRRLGIGEMDPSMLIGFLVTSREDFEDWRRAVVEGGKGKQIVHVHEREPESFAPGSGGVGGERAGAVDEVETWDETEEDGEEV